MIGRDGEWFELADLPCVEGEFNMLERGRWSAANDTRCPRRVVRALACRFDRFAFVEVTACGFAHAAIATR